MLNVYITLKVLGWEGHARQVVILDSHPPGPLDALWPVAAAGGGTAALAAVRQAQAQESVGGSSVGGGGSSSGVHLWDVRLPGTGSAAGSGRILVRRVEDFKASDG